MAAKDAVRTSWFAGECRDRSLGLAERDDRRRIAYLAKRFPAHIEALETGAGALLLGGLALASCGLPVIL